MKVCVSCGRDSTLTSTTFPCPSCGTELSRCEDCKLRGNHYTCINDCGFSGP